MNQEQKEIIKRLNSKFINNVYLGFTNLEELKKQYLSALKDVIKWDCIDRQDCILLGLKRWDDTDEKLKNLFLLPFYLHSIIPEGLKVWCIDGEETEWNKTKDTDTRFGMLAYGIMVEESRC